MTVQQCSGLLKTVDLCVKGRTDTFVGVHLVSQALKSQEVVP